MRDYGQVTTVETRIIGDELASGVSIAGTVFALTDTADFTDARFVQIGLEVLKVQSVDDDAGTVTVVTGPTLAYSTEEPVYLWPLGQETVAWVAVERDADPIACDVPQTLIPLMTDGNKTYADAEQVVIESYDDSTWTVVNIVGKAPLMDGAYLDPGSTVPPLALSDGLPPAAPGVPLVKGVPRQIIAQIDGVVNHDAVSYEWHLSTSTATPTFNGATAHHADPATMAVFAAQVDGVTPLAYETVYYIGAFAYDVDPGASAFSGWSAGVQLDPNGTADIAVGSILAAKIDVVDLMASGLRTASSGQRWAVNTTEGMVIYDSAENLRASFPMSGDGFQIHADLETDHVTVNDNLTLRGTGNVFAKGAEVTLQSSIQAAQSPPAAAVGWPALGLATDPAFRPTDNRRGLHLYSSAWWIGYRFPTGGFLTAFNTTTGALTGSQFNLPAGMQPDGGICHMVITANNRWLILCKQDSDNSWWVVMTDDVGVEITRWAWTAGDTAAGAAIATDGTAVFIAQRLSGTTYRTWQYTPTGSGGSTVDCVASIGSPSASEVNGFYVGSADFGAARFAISLKADQRVRVFNSTTGVEQSNVSFVTANAERVAGLAWDGTNFYTASRISAGVYKYSDIFKTSAELLSWSAYTWEDTDATGGLHETQMSTQIQKTVIRRQSITVTTAAIPDLGGTDDPDSVNIYVGYKATLPTRTEMWLHASPASGIKTATITAQVGSGTNPPAANNFPGAVPFKVKNSSGAVLLDADDTPWTAYTPVVTGASTNPTTSNSTLTGRYMVRQKAVKFELTLTVGSSWTSTPGSGIYSVTLPPVTPAHQNYTFFGKYRDISVPTSYWLEGENLNAAGTIRLTVLPTTAGNPLAGFTATNPATIGTGDIIFISGIYEAA